MVKAAEIFVVDGCVFRLALLVPGLVTRLLMNVKWGSTPFCSSRKQLNATSVESTFDFYCNGLVSDVWVNIKVLLKREEQHEAHL